MRDECVLTVEGVGQLEVRRQDLLPRHKWADAHSHLHTTRRAVMSP